MVHQEAVAPCPRGHLPLALPMRPREFRAVEEGVVRQVATAVVVVVAEAEGGTEDLFPPPTLEEVDGAQ